MGVVSNNKKPSCRQDS